MSKRKQLTIDILKKTKGPIIPPKELIKRVQRDTKIKNMIKKALSDGPKNVVEIAKITGLDTYTVAWYIATFLRYGYVRSKGKDDDGYLVVEWGEG